MNTQKKLAALVFLIGLLSAATGRAQIDPGGFYGPTNTPLDSWSFYDDHTNWTSDLKYPPLSFTNLNFSYLGDGASLVVDTNIPAWLQYNVFESDGTTNLTVDSGTVTFWFAPNWSSAADTNGGFGPGEYGRLFEVGSYTTNSSYGFWSIYVDDLGNNLYFSAQTNDLSSTLTTYLSAPIDWTTNYFHFVALTYSPTNTALYLDGAFVTNGPGVTVYPGPDVLTNGFCIGSDNTGVLQSHGLFNTVQTYNSPLSSNDVQTLFDWNYTYYMISPWNTVMANISTPSTNDLWLQFGSAGGGSASLYVTVPLSTAGTNFMFDVFATTNLTRNVPGLNATNWMYVMRAMPGQTNLILPTLPNAPVCFYRLGTMLDSDGDGIPDAYENLVGHTDPNSPDTDGDGISDGDAISPSGLPWRLELARKWGAIIYANSPTATQGGTGGQCTVYLPTPAPSGGTTVQYYLGGSAVLTNDYTVSPTVGQLTILAGSSNGVINISATSGSTYSPINLYADLILTNAPGYRVDGTPARVNIVDTGSPSVRVYALPQWTHRPCATYGTNAVGFYFIRGGTATNSLTANLSYSGSTAVGGVDYTALPTSIVFSNNVRTNWLPVSIFVNSTNPADKNLTVTISSATGYQIDPTNGVATMTIAATASPVLPVVQVTATVPDATTTTPGQFTFTRSFATTSALRVYFNSWGATNTVVSSTGGVDSPLYRALPGYVDIPANTTNVVVSLVVSNAMTTTQPIIVTLAQGSYTIGANNMATVYVDGAGAIGIDPPIITRNGVYGPNENDAVEITLTRHGSALSPMLMSWFNVTNSYIGFKISSATMTGDLDTSPGGVGSHIRWAARQNVAKVHVSISYFWNSTGSADYEQWLLPGVTLSNAYYNTVLALPYTPQWNMVKLSSLTSPATLITNGNTVANALTITRPWTQSSGAKHPIQVGITLSGSAAYGTDYTMSTVVNIASNQTTLTVPIQALTATNQGWRTVVATLKGVYPSTQASPDGNDLAFARIQNPANLVSDTDMDGDGLPDGFELNNPSLGIDPLTPDNSYQDDDRDGLGLIEELALGTDPNTPDAPPVYPSIEPSDYVAMTMRVGAIGKMLVQPSQSCAVCHAVTLRAGNLIRTSGKTDWTHNPTTTDYLVSLLRGTNYPVQVTCNPYYNSLLTSNQMVAANAAQASGSPHYTAAYVAQFLLDTNGGPWPFIVDTNHLLGTNLPMVVEATTRRATLYVPDLTIAADNDRTGVIDFQDRDDRTAATNPFVFWINDDCDSGSDDTASDLDPSANPPDSANSAIGNVRDLEDFARLQFKIDALPPQFLTNGNYQVKVYLTNLVGSPSLRLFPAADSSGGIGYLTNTTTGTAQIAKTMLGVVTNGTPLTIAGTNWQTAGVNNFFLPMIFEGISTGQCVITFGFSTNNQPPVALSRPFYLNLKRATDLYEHWTVGDNTTTEWVQILRTPVSRTADSAVFTGPTTANDLNYILFVHGWRMQPWERRAFASTAYKRLYWQNYKGKFGFFSWPTDWENLGSSHLSDLSFWSTTLPNGLLNVENFDVSERRAWNSGHALYRLLANLNQYVPPYQMRLFAHSMGNVVAGEALREATDENSKPVQVYVALQGALAAHCYDSNAPIRTLDVLAGVNTDSSTFNLYRYYWQVPTLPASYTSAKPYLYNVNAAGVMVNYVNPLDAALSGWRYNQDLKPDFNWSYYAPPQVLFQPGFVRFLPYGHLDYIADRYEIFSRAAEARCYAMGAQTNLAGPFQSSQVNLQSTLGFTDADSDHSGEFNSTIQRRAAFWNQLLFDLKLK